MRNDGCDVVITPRGSEVQSDQRPLAAIRGGRRARRGRRPGRRRLVPLWTIALAVACLMYSSLGDGPTWTRESVETARERMIGTRSPRSVVPDGDRWRSPSNRCVPATT